MKRLHARVQAGLVALSMLAATALQAQSSPNAAPLAYEAVSIKPNRSGSLSLGGMSSAPDGGFTMTNAALGLLLGQAFPQSTRDMSGLPSWTSSERFDVIAKGPVGAKPDAEQRAGMLRAMLVDRFKLRTHVEAREQPAYDLVLAQSDGKLGPNLTPSDFDCGTVAAAAAAARETGAPPPPLPTLAGGIPACTQRSLGKRFDGHMTIATLATGALRGMTD